jgi:hypothetical protein
VGSCGFQNNRGYWILIHELADRIQIVVLSNQHGAEGFRRNAGSHWDVERDFDCGGSVIVQAVKVPLELDDFAMTCVSASHSQRKGGCFASGYCETDTFSARDAFTNQLGPTNLELVASAIMQATMRLIGDRCDDGGMVMAENESAVTAPAVEVAMAVAHFLAPSARST